MTTDTLTAPGDVRTAEGRRIAAFLLSPTAADIFHSVVDQNDIWKSDPFDVESIHADARAVYQRLHSRAASPPPLASGRILLLLGEGGSGKTHLMRAFRNYTHERGLGYFGYLQMTSAVSNYARYVLTKLIEALDQPYCEPAVPQSGLMMLSGALFDSLPMVAADERAQLREGFLTPPQVIESVQQYADCALRDSRFTHIDVDLLRALLFLQRDDPILKNRVLKYLRCEDLGPYDRQVLGGVVPRNQEESPMEMIAWLGRTMWAVQSAPLVLCFDQLEDVVNQDAADKDAALRFRKVIDTAVAITAEVPTSVVVISCLEDYYTKFRGQVTQTKLDRVEKDPEPMHLTSHRNAGEVAEVVGRRFRFLCNEEGVPFDEKNATSPFTRENLKWAENQSARFVLDFCRLHREKCIQAGGIWVKPDRPIIIPHDLTAIKQRWNDFCATPQTPPDGEDDLAALLTWGIERCSDEVDSGYWFAAEAEGRLIPVEVHGPDNGVVKLLVGVCNKAPQRGALNNQLKEVLHRAGEHPAVMVRSTDFPKGAKTEATKLLAEVIQKGGRKAVVEDTDWRTILALRAFREKEKDAPERAEWLRQSRPLTSLKSMQTILTLDSLPRTRPPAADGTPKPPPPVAVKPPTPPPQPPPSPAPTGPLILGISGDRSAGEVTLQPKDLTTHAAFLGGTGSGKTTLALNLIEQLLLRGVPAVLIDRKGDLCGYAEPSAWARPLADPADAERRQRLRDRIDVHVFTPGHPAGRPLTIPIVPDGMKDLAAFERDQMAGYAAAALGGMMDYKPRGRDAQRLAVLRQAIGLLGGDGGPVTVPVLIEFIHGQDASLVNAVGVLDVRQFNVLAQDLQTLWLRRKDLLEDGAERLDVEYLLGLGRHVSPGKTRLSVVSTRFLGDAAAVEFWVAQFLLEATRWAGRHPWPDLQAVLLFDEADLYLPAVKQPATKAPMENLLRRARSAGVGLLLATQSPGDFDYKCRDNIGSWLAGKITQQTALDKMKPLFSECRIDVAAKLPGQGRGQFHLLRPPAVAGFAARPSLIATEQLPEDRILELARALRR